MFLPSYVQTCIQALQKQGFAAYCVGGCVRDALLGLEPKDYDLCTSASPQMLCRIFADYPLVRSGEKHGTIGVVTHGQVLEITTFRTEGDYRDGRHPDWVTFVPNVEQDLARRDFTVNAMAYSPDIGLVDPFGGRADLEKGILRAVGDPYRRFREDSLRILRGARFAAAYRLQPEQATAQAMQTLAPLMEGLARERVYSELCKLLLAAEASDLIGFAPLLTQVIPELEASVGFDQRSPHHAYDVFTHTAYVVAAVPRELPLRWAALLHDVGKPATFTTDETGRGHFYGHAPLSAQMADTILLRLKAPTALREQVTFLIQHHMTPLTPDRQLLRRRLSKWGEDRVFALLALEKADFSSKGVPGGHADFDGSQALLQDILRENSCLTLKDLAVGGNDLLALGYSGREIGQALQQLLESVLDEQLPNEKDALLAAVQRK